MRAGALNRRLIVESPQVLQDNTGGEVVTWVTFATVWARIRPLRGRETLIANEILANLDTRINIRWSPNLDQITEKWRLRHQGIKYDIVSLSHVEYRQREIELMCKSGLTDG